MFRKQSPNMTDLLNSEEKSSLRQAQMSRLSSFRRPSTPTSSPVRQPKQQGRSTPSSPSNPIESTYHRKVRTCLQEIRAVTETWEDLVLLDGLKSLKNLVNTRTNLEYDSFIFLWILHVEKKNLLSFASGLAMS